MEFVSVTCPYCLQDVELDLDPETVGDFVQDCEVCCRPWAVHVERDGDGTPTVTLSGDLG